MAHIVTEIPHPAGWQCPACRHVYGPQVSECHRCPADAEPVTITVTGSVDPRALARLVRHEIHCHNIRNGGTNG